MKNFAALVLLPAPALLLVLLPALLLAASVARADDWPQYRGPLQSGGSTQAGVFTEKDFGLAPVWKKSLGRGYSSIVIQGDVAVTMFGDEKDAGYIVAFDAATGDQRWRYRVGGYYAAHTGSEGGPSSTPTIHDGTVYAVGRYGRLVALSLSDGAERWAVELEGQSYAKTPHYGWTTSPVVVDKIVLLMTGGAGSGNSISAFDRKTGKHLWSRGDGAVNYQTPAVLTLAGRRQLVVVNDDWLIGMEPASGEILWQHDHDTFTVEAFAQPTAIDGDRFLINSLQEVAAYEVSAEGDRFAVREVWRNNQLKSSYAIPVVHGGSIFGFSRNILVCLDAATGELRWKSREPGGRGLTLVDGHLVILGPEGDIVVAAAQPDGYAERARVATFDRYSHSVPSFANGWIYARNESEIAAVEVVSGKAPPLRQKPSDSPRLVGAFGERIRAAEASAEASGDAAAALASYLAEQESLPLIEGDPGDPGEPGDLVHFIYQSDAEAVGVSGSFLEWWDPVEMHRVAGTDIFFLSMRLDPTAVWEYRFHPDFEQRVRDPRNPVESGRYSVLRMPGWEAPAHLEEPSGPRGRIDSFEFRSDILDDTRRIRLYLPAGYARSSERYPVVFVQQGGGALDGAGMDRTLDNIVGSRVRPMIAVFLPGPAGLEEMAGERTPLLSRFVAEELVPFLDRNYRTIAERTSRALIGPEDGGILALYAALQLPEVFGMAAAQSGHLQVRVADELLAMIAAAGEPRPTIYLQWTPNDSKFGEGGIDSRAGSMKLTEAFREAGYDVHGGEVPGSSGWSTWRAYYDDILETFFPVVTPVR